MIARAEGDEYVVSGQKAAWVSNGAIATHALTYLNLDRSLGLAGGGIAFIPLDLPGVSRGRTFNKIGQRDLAQAEIVFDQVRLPKRHVFVGAASYEFTLTRTLTAATIHEPIETSINGRGAPFVLIFFAAAEMALEVRA